MAAVFPSVGVCALVLGVLVLRDRRPLGGHGWVSFAAILLALVPAVRRAARERAGSARRRGRAREAEERSTVRDRELGAVATISNALVRLDDAVAVGRVVADEVARLLDVEFAARRARRRATAREASGSSRAPTAPTWPGGRDVGVDLRNEPSGIASAVFEGAPVQVYDAGSVVPRQRRGSPRPSARRAAPGSR